MKGGIVHPFIQEIKEARGTEGSPRPAFLAPLAGYSDLPFRRLCAKEGSLMQTTELVSAAGISYGGLKRSWRYLAIEPESEGRVMIQLFGSEPEHFVRAAEAVLADPELKQCLGIDINMGCPVPKVVKGGAGSALMAQPERAEEILKRLKPLLAEGGYLLGVKMRRGFEGEEETAPELARRLAAAGADLITVHGRFREQYYSGKADWGVIRRVHEALEEAGLREQVLLAANGDIKDAASYDACLAYTLADAAAVGRAAMGRPWIFRELRAEPEPDAREKAALIWEHAEAETAFLGEATAMREFRKTLSAYASGRPQAKALRRRCAEISTLDDVRDWLELFLYGKDEFFV